MIGRAAKLALHATALIAASTTHAETLGESLDRDQVIDGYALLAICGEGEHHDMNKCMAFTRAVVTGFEYGIDFSKGKNTLYCKKDMMQAVLWGTVKEFVEQNPGVRSLGAERVVLLALEAKFPCA